jgi:hypothetical protein
MGLAESTLKTTAVKPLVRPDSSAPLPSFNLESAKYIDGSVGFIVTHVDIAKNINSYKYVIRTVVKTSDTTLVYSCTDESIFTFVKDLLTNKVYCFTDRVNVPVTILRPCITNYEPLENEVVDAIKNLYS